MVAFTQEHCKQRKHTSLYSYITQWQKYEMIIQTNKQNLQEIPEISHIVLEWRNIKPIIPQASDEILGKCKAFTQKKN